MPAHAGIQSPHAHVLDSRFRGNDATPTRGSHRLAVYLRNGHLDEPYPLGSFVRHRDPHPGSPTPFVPVIMCPTTARA
jgi:hypothetical protein